MKLTDTHLVILSSASQRDDRGVIIPPNLKGAAARKTVERLLDAGMISETRRTGDLPEWRRDESGSFALVITDKGLEAIGLDPRGDAPSPARTATKSPARSSAAKAAPTKNNADAVSKSDQLIAMLRAKGGASIADVGARLGWQPHSARAAISGLRKRGISVDQSRSKDGVTIYRIGSGTSASRAKATALRISPEDAGPRSISSVRKSSMN